MARESILKKYFELLKTGFFHLNYSHDTSKENAIFLEMARFHFKAWFLQAYAGGQSMLMWEKTSFVGQAPKLAELTVVAKNHVFWKNKAISSDSFTKRYFF